MPATAAPAVPVLHYVLHENFTPAHRAQLSRSHRKVEQLLGVTPSLRPVPPSQHLPVPNLSQSHRRTQSYVDNLNNSSKRKSNGRERGKLCNLFGIEMKKRSSEDGESTDGFLTRISTSSSTTSLSSTSSLPEPLNQGPRYKQHRPPRLNIKSNFDQLKEPMGDIVLDISPRPPPVVPVIVPTIVTTKVDLESPLTPLFKVDLPRKRSRASILEEREWNRIVSGVNKLPIDPKEKSRKLNRLGKVFGVLPPLEMVFPPTPSSRSRFDPKRYTLELPPPLVRGTLTDDLNDKHPPPRELIVELDENAPGNDEKVMRVVWDTVTDEASRQKVMDALRMLR